MSGNNAKKKLPVKSNMAENTGSIVKNQKSVKKETASSSRNQAPELVPYSEEVNFDFDSDRDNSSPPRLFPEEIVTRTKLSRTQPRRNSDSIIGINLSAPKLREANCVELSDSSDDAAPSKLTGKLKESVISSEAKCSKYFQSLSSKSKPNVKEHTKQTKAQEPKTKTEGVCSETNNSHTSLQKNSHKTVPYVRLIKGEVLSLDKTNNVPSVKTPYDSITVDDVPIVKNLSPNEVSCENTKTDVLHTNSSSVFNSIVTNLDVESVNTDVCSVHPEENPSITKELEETINKSPIQSKISKDKMSDSSSVYNSSVCDSDCNLDNKSVSGCGKQIEKTSSLVAANNIEEHNDEITIILDHPADSKIAGDDCNYKKNETSNVPEPESIASEEANSSENVNSNSDTEANNKSICSVQKEVISERKEKDEGLLSNRNSDLLSSRVENAKIYNISCSQQEEVSSTKIQGQTDPLSESDSSSASIRNDDESMKTRKPGEQIVSVSAVEKPSRSRKEPLPHKDINSSFATDSSADTVKQAVPTSPLRLGCQSSVQQNDTTKHEETRHADNKKRDGLTGPDIPNDMYRLEKDTIVTQSSSGSLLERRHEQIEAVNRRGIVESNEITNLEQQLKLPPDMEIKLSPKTKLCKTSKTLTAIEAVCTDNISDEGKSLDSVNKDIDVLAMTTSKQSIVEFEGKTKSTCGGDVSVNEHATGTGIETSRRQTEGKSVLPSKNGTGCETDISDKVSPTSSLLDKKKLEIKAEVISKKKRGISERKLIESIKEKCESIENAMKKYTVSSEAKSTSPSLECNELEPKNQTMSCKGTDINEIPNIGEVSKEHSERTNEDNSNHSSLENTSLEFNSNSKSEDGTKTGETQLAEHPVKLIETNISEKTLVEHANAVKQCDVLEKRSACSSLEKSSLETGIESKSSKSGDNSELSGSEYVSNSAEILEKPSEEESILNNVQSCSSSLEKTSLEFDIESESNNEKDINELKLTEKATVQKNLSMVQSKVPHCSNSKGNINEAEFLLQVEKYNRTIATKLTQNRCIEGMLKKKNMNKTDDKSDASGDDVAIIKVLTVTSSDTNGNGIDTYKEQNLQRSTFSKSRNQDFQLSDELKEIESLKDSQVSNMSEQNSEPENSDYESEALEMSSESSFTLAGTSTASVSNSLRISENDNECDENKHRYDGKINSFLQLGKNQEQNLRGNTDGNVSPDFWADYEDDDEFFTRPQHLSTGKEEREKIDGNELFLFESEQDMVEFTQINHDFWQCLSMDDGEDVGDASAVSREDMQHVQKTIVPKKSYDITKIKGWKNKQFAVNNNVGSSCGFSRGSCEDENGFESSDRTGEINMKEEKQNNNSEDVQNNDVSNEASSDRHLNKEEQTSGRTSSFSASASQISSPVKDGVTLNSGKDSPENSEESLLLRMLKQKDKKDNADTSKSLNENKQKPNTISGHRFETTVRPEANGHRSEAAVSPDIPEELNTNSEIHPCDADILIRYISGATLELSYKLPKLVAEEALLDGKEAEIEQMSPQPLLKPIEIPVEPSMQPTNGVPNVSPRSLTKSIDDPLVQQKKGGGPKAKTVAEKRKLMERGPKERLKKKKLENTNTRNFSPEEKGSRVLKMKKKHSDVLKPNKFAPLLKSGGIVGLDPNYKYALVGGKAIRLRGTKLPEESDKIEHQEVNDEISSQSHVTLLSSSNATKKNEISDNVVSVPSIHEDVKSASLNFKKTDPKLNHESKQRISPQKPKLKLLQRSSSPKPNPVSEKQDSSQGQNLQSEKEIITAKTLMYGLQVSTGVGYPVHPQAALYLRKLRSMDIVINKTWANFAASVVVTKNDIGVKKLPEKHIIPVKKHVFVPQKKTNTFMRSANNNTVAKGKKTMQAEVTCDAVQSEVKLILEQMVECVANREIENSIVKDDPDAASNTPASDTTAKCTKRSRKRRNRVFRELNRLDVNVIVMGDDNDIRNDYCQQEHCKLGCVCSSINCDPLSITPEHCGNVECMFECSCKDKESPEVPAGSDSGEKCSMLYNTAMQLQNEENRRLAKVEKEFKHTVVQSKNETVVLRGGSKGGGGKQRREIKLPERYRDSVLGKEFAIAELNMISGDTSTNLPSVVSTSGPKRLDKLQFPKYIQVGLSTPTPKLPRQGYKLTRGKLTEEQKNSLRRERFKVHTIVPYVDKLKINDLVPLCMDHSLYNCNICFGQKSKHTRLSKGEPEYEKLLHKERSKSRPLANILSHDVYRNSARTNGATINYAIRNNCHCFKEWHKSLLNENKDDRKNVLTEVDPLAECPDPNISDYLTSYPGHFLASGDPQLMSMYSGEDESAGLVITSIESLKPGEFENVDCINESSERSEQEVIERECLKRNPTEAPASTSGILQDILSNKNVASASMIRMENTYLIPVLPDGSSDIHSTTLEKLISRREVELKDILQNNLPFDLSAKPQGSIQLLNWIDLVEKVKSKLCHLWLHHKRGTVPQLLVTPYILRPNPFCTSINGDFYKLDLRGNMPPLISFLLSEIYWNENLLRNDACYGLLYFERQNWVLVGSLIKETISQEAFSNADVQWDHRAKPVIDLSSESFIPDISVQGVHVSTKNINGELARALAVESPADAYGQVEKSSESPQALNICRIEQVHTFAKKAAENPDQLASAGSDRGQTISLMTKNAIAHPERSHTENSLKDVQTSNLDIKIASVSTLSHKKSTWNITYGADDEVDSAGEEPVENTTVENDTELSDSTENTNKSVLLSEDELRDTIPSTVDIASTACSLNREDPSVNVDVTSAGENDDKHKKSNSSTCEVNNHLFDLRKNASNDESTFDESNNVTKGPERSDKVENTDKSVLLPDDLECDTAHSAQVESSADKEKNLPQCDTAHSAQVESSADKEKSLPQSSDKTERNVEETSDQHKEDDSTKTEKNDCSSEKQNFLSDNSHEMDNSNTVTSQVEDKNQASTEIIDTALGETNNDDGFLKIVHVEQVDPNVFNCVDDVEDGINIDSSTSNQAGSSHSENISTESRERNIDSEASSFDTASGDVIVTFMAEGKKSSKKRGLTSIQSTVSEPYVSGLEIYLPAGNRPVRWFMLNIEKVFDMLHVGHNKSFIRYLQLLRTTKLAISLNKTVRLPLIKDPRDKYRNETEVTQVTESDLPKFGVYAAPPLFTRMFIGPYDLDEEARVSVIKNIGGKLMNILHMDLENCQIEAHIIHSVFRGVLERMRNNKMEKLYDSCAFKPHGSKNNLGVWLYTEAYCRGDARNKSRVRHHSRIGGGIEGEGELLSEEQNAATNIKIVSVHGNVRSSDSAIRPDPEIQEGSVDNIPQISLVETIEGPDIEFEKRTVDDTSKMTDSVASFETNILKTSHQRSTDARFTVDETSQKAAKDASFETTTSGKTSHQRNTDARFTVDEISQMTADDASFEITTSDTISHQRTTDTSFKTSSADKISEITSDDAISVGEKIIQMNSNDLRSQMKVSDARIQLETSDNTIQLEASDAGSSCNNHVKTTVTSTHLEISNTITQIPTTNTAIPSTQLDTSDTTAQTTIDKDQLISSDAVDQTDDTKPQRRSSTNRRKQVLELRSGDELVEENKMPSEDLATEHLSLNLDSTAVNSSLKNKPIGPKPVFAHEDYNLPATHFVNVPDWADGNYSLITNEEDDQEETLDVETPCNSVAMFRQVHLTKNRSSSATIPRVSSSPRKKAAPASKASRMIGKTGVPIRLIPNVQEVGYVTASMFHNKSVLLDDPFTTTPEPSYFRDLKTATRWLTDKLKSVVEFIPPDLPFRWKVRQAAAKHNCKRLNPELLETMTLTSEGLVRKQVSTQSSSAAMHPVPGKEEPSDEESDDHGRTPVPVVIQQTSEMKGLVEKGKREIPDLQAHAQNEKRRRQEILDGFHVLTNLLLSEDEKKLLGNKFSVLKMAELEINRLHKEEQRLKIEYKLEKQRRMNTFREFIRQANVLPDAEDMKREMMNYITRELKTRKRPALPQTKDYHKPLPRPFKKRKRSSGPSKTGKPSHTNSSNIEVVDVTSSSSSSVSEYLSDGKSSEEPITSKSDDCKKPERKKSRDVSISLEKSKQRTNHPAAAASEKNNDEDDDGDVDDDVIVTRIIPPKNKNSLLRAGRFPPEVIIEPQKKLSVSMSCQVLPNRSDDYKCFPSDKTVNNVVDQLEGFRGFETTAVGKNIGNLSPKPRESEGFIKLYEKLMHDEKLTYAEKLMQAEKLIQAENASTIDRLCLRLTDRDLMRSYTLNKTQENRMDSSSEAKDWSDRNQNNEVTQRNMAGITQFKNYLDLKQIVESEGRFTPETKSHNVHGNKIMFIRDNVTLSRNRDILPINVRNLDKCGNKNTDSITKVKGIGISGPELPHVTMSELIPLHGTVNTIPEAKEDIEPFDIEKLPIFFEGTDIQNSLEDNININDNDFRAFTTLLEPETRTTEIIEMKPSEITPNSHVSRIADVVAFKRKISKNSDCQVMDRDDWKPAPKVRIFPKTLNANPITTTTKTLIRQFPLLSTAAKLTPLNPQVYGSRIVYSIPPSRSASSHTVTECSSSAVNSKTALTSTITRPVTTGTSSGGAIMKALGPTVTSGSKTIEINTETATAVSSAMSSSKPIGSKLDKKDLFMKFMTLKPGQLVPSLTKWGSPMGKVSMTHLGATNKVTVSNIGTLHPSTSEEATKSTESQPTSSSPVKGAIPTTVVAVNKTALSTSQLVFPLSSKCVTVADGKKMFSSTSTGITLKPVPSTSAGITLKSVPSTSTGITLKSVPSTSGGIKLRPVSSTSGGIKLRPVSSTSGGIKLRPVSSTSGGIKLRPVSSTSVSMCGNNLLNLKGRKNYVICSKEELYGKPKGHCERIPIVVTSTSSQKSLSLLKHLTQGAREGQTKVKVPCAAVKNLGSGATLTSSSSKLTAHTNPTATLLASRPSISVQKSLLENSAIKITPHVLNFSNLMEKIKYTNRMKVQKKEPKSIEKILNFSSISASTSTNVSDSDRTDNTEENNSIVDEEKNIASTNQDAKKEEGLAKTDNTRDSNSKNQTKLTLLKTRKRTLNVDETSPNQEHKKVIRAGKSKDSNKNKVTRSERHLRVKDEQSSKGSVSTSSESSQANASERIQNKKSNSVKRTKVFKLLNKKKNLKEGVKRTLVGRRPVRMVTRSKLKKKKHTECCK